MTDGNPRDHALGVVNELAERSSEAKARAPRLLTCLSDFEGGFTKGWFMAVPASFRQALDMRKDERVVEREGGKVKSMVWTQDGHFDFHRGDTLFDHETAYSASTWFEAMARVRWVLQVAEDPAFFPGHVVMDVFKVSPESKRVVTVARETLPCFEFVRLLIEGPSEALREKWEA